MLKNKINELFSRKSTGRCCYKIPNGGSCLIGVFGYIEAFHEMLEQGIADHVTDIVVTCGSGGTVSGLAIANYLACNGKIRYTVVILQLHLKLRLFCIFSEYN